jgi:hypothetical protein
MIGKRSATEAAKRGPSAWKAALVVALLALPSLASATTKNDVVNSGDLREISSETVILELTDPNGDPVTVSGTRQTYVPSGSNPAGRHALLSCTYSRTVGNPYYFYSGGHRAGGYAEASASSGCVQGIGLAHHLQEFEAWWVTRAGPTAIFANPGQTKSHTVVASCTGTASESWQHVGTEYIGGPIFVAQPATLGCNN